MGIRKLKKLFTFVALLSMFVQSLAPYTFVLPGAVFAQEATVTPAPTDSPSLPPTDTPAPTDTVTPTPEPNAADATPTPIESGQADTVTPTPIDPSTSSGQASSPQADTPTVAPTSDQASNSNSTPDNNSNNNSNTTPAPTDVVAPTDSTSSSPADTKTEKTGKENVSFTILENVSAPSINLEAANTQSSASLTTDKLDYAPTDAAMITGTGLLPKTTYILYVSSTDPPPVNFSTEVITTDQGSFVYAYQLDGNYRPNYKVELKDQSGQTIASTTFTDSPTCSSDAQGVNDQPGQKDLTKMCADYAGVPNTISINWNWDEINGSGGNTFDACSLYDTDGDGNANYSVCVTVTGSPLVQAASSPRIYSCNDANSDKCSGDTLIAGPYATTCSTAQQNTDPFPAGDANPNDTVATCTITLSEVGGSASKLLDVCSYPSQQPNSDPSDCIIASTASQTGSVELKKVWSGTPGQTTLNIGSTAGGTEIASVQTGADGGTPLTTGTKIVSTGTFYVSETGGLTNYTSSLSCTKNGQAYTPGTNNSLVIGNNDIFICTFTNTRVNNGTINIVKVGENNNPQDFGFNTTGGLSLDETSSPDFSLDDDGDNGNTLSNTKTFTGVAAGTYTVSEIATAGWTLGSIVCTDPTQNSTSGLPAAPTATINLAAGESVTCTFTNTLNRGNIKVNKMVDTNGDGDYTDTGEGLNGTASNAFTWTYRGVGPNAMGATQSGLTSGSGSLSENTVTNYHLVGWYSGQGSCASPDSTTLPASIDIVTNQTVEITICNAIDTGTVIVHKDVQGPNGEDVSDASNNFKVSLDGGTGQDITDDLTVTYNNVPVGSHTITESLIDTDYTLYGISQTQGQSGNTSGLTITVTTGTNDVYVTNRQKTGTITVVKDVVNPDGGAVSDTHSFTVNLTPGGQSSAFAEGSNAVFTVNPGTYTASESADADYTALGCLTATGNADIVVGSGESKTVTCTNQQKKATINVIKDVLSPTNGAISDNHAFTAQLNGGNDQSFSEATTASYLVNPGSHSITELTDNNYDYVSCTPDNNQTAGDGAQVTVGSNDSVTITCTNKQKNAQVTVVKDVRDPNGSDVSDNTNFVVQRGGADDKDFHEGLNAVYILAPGTYTFSEIVTAGYTLNSISNDNDADVSNGTTVTLHSGENQTITFTNYQNSGSISGQKFGDTDGVLGTTDDQSNLVNWVIELYTCTSNFTGCVLSTSDTTDSSGYSFLNLVPGYYQVKEVLQSGWTALTSLFHNVTVSPGENETGKNFVNFENVTVTACKVIDADGDITTTEDQANEYGWTVNLLTDGETSDTKTTGEDGCYTWTDLGPGHSYGVSEEVPQGWVNLVPFMHTFGPATGGSKYTYTFVNFENVSISGHKWNDFDGNGIWDSGEPALQNWIINLSGASSGSDTTDSNGEYSFSNLGPGTYTLSETGQTGWVQTYPTDPTSHSVTVASGQNVTDKDFGNQGRGSITVHKMVDNNGDGTYVSGDDGDFTWTLDETGTNIMGDTVSDIPAGQHSVDESTVPDYHFVGWFYADDEGSCENERDLEGTSLPININVSTNEATDITFCNARDTGKITVNKEVVSLTEDSGMFDLQIDGTTEKTDAQNGDSTGAVTVLTGTHSVGEVEGTQTSLSDYVSTISCDDENESYTDGTSLSEIQVNSGDEITCTITNTKKGKVIVTKYNDPDGEGVFNPDGEVLEGWGINLGGQTKTTGSDGQAIFDNLIPDTYVLSENLEAEPGWEQTDISCDNRNLETNFISTDGFYVNVGAGQTVNCRVLNHSLTPILKISKTNNSLGIDKAQGDNVIYTLTVTLEQSDAHNVTVTDLLPQGFKYRAGSWTAVSTGTGARGDLRALGITTEPTYSSPGTWNLGNMVPGEIVTLTLIADIDGGQHPGLYKDVAWAQGTSLSSVNVLALAQPTGYVDTNFVGTQVNVVKNLQNSVSVSVTEKEGEVLGASTELPATGANNIWVMLASVMLGLGLSLATAGYIMRKKYV